MYRSIPVRDGERVCRQTVHKSLFVPSAFQEHYNHEGEENKVFAEVTKQKEVSFTKRQGYAMEGRQERETRSLGGSRQLVVQSLSESLLLALAFQLHQVLSVLGARVVNTAFGLLLALPATRALVLVGSDGLGGVPVTNTLVAPVKELIVGNVVLLDVLLDLVEGPVGHGVDLDKTGLVNLNDVEVTTLTTLTAAATSKDGMDIQFAIGTLSRLDLGDPVVELIISLPKARAVLGFEFLGVISTSRLVHVHGVVGVALPDTVDQVESLLEVMQSVEEDEVNHLRPGYLELRQHIQGDETRQTKGSSLEQMRERCDAPFQDFYSIISQIEVFGSGVEHRMKTYPEAQGIAAGGSKTGDEAW
jgi:hypothetical protein